ncbi:MAG: LamG domain-containing protein, partial [Gammaproteobacteria bacterium]|nr:LamG domain-containing protein [Gammaproteobacteria bacterium]
TTGIVNGALNFDGSYDYALVSNYPKPDSVMTVTAWAYARARPNWASIVKNWAGPTGAFHFGLKENDGDLEVQITEADGDVVDIREGSTNLFPLDSWQHVALIADGSRIRLFRNATQVASAAYDGTLKTSFNALAIGMKPNDSGTGPNQWAPGFWDGKIDEVRMYDRALSPLELLDIYSAGVLSIDENEGGKIYPAEFILEQNYPNPFNPVTIIDYSLPKTTRVILQIYNLN